MSTRANPDDVTATLRALAEQVSALRQEVAAVAGDLRVLRDRLETNDASPGRTRPASKPKREGRRRGLAAAMARLFWDRMMQNFVEVIRREGPMTAAQLHATLDADVLEMAESAFERIDVSLIAEKLNERVRRGHYVRRTGDDLYDVL